MKSFLISTAIFLLIAGGVSGAYQAYAMLDTHTATLAFLQTVQRLRML